MSKKELQSKRIIAQNKKARFNYIIENTYEAGIVLFGSEVKSLRQGSINIDDSHASVTNNEVILYNTNIPEYKCATIFNHIPRRPRKLLLHKNEIKKIFNKTRIKGYSLIPTSMYFDENNRVKIEMAVGKGKKQHDKRQTLKERDWEREKARGIRKK